MLLYFILSNFKQIIWQSQIVIDKGQVVEKSIFCRGIVAMIMI